MCGSIRRNLAFFAPCGAASHQAWKKAVAMLRTMNFITSEY
jgi:hypothetical protein